MDKQNVVYLCSGRLFGPKKEWSSDTWYNRDDPWKRTKGKKAEKARLKGDYWMSGEGVSKANGRGAMAVDAALPLEVLKAILNHVTEAQLGKCTKTHWTVHFLEWWILCSMSSISRFTKDAQEAWVQEFSREGNMADV